MAIKVDQHMFFPETCFASTISEPTYHSGPEALTIIFEKFWFLCLRVAALAYVDAYTMLKVFYEKQI